MRMTKKLGLALALTASMGANAAYMTGNEFLENLEGTPVKHGLATGYVIGIFDSHDKSVFCPPSGMKVSQVVDLAQQYIQKQPAHRHWPAYDLIMYVFTETWPCKKK